jgi:hypothetical protein
VADYREISQEYAKSAINGALLINAGASVAVLSQLAELYKVGLLSSVVLSVEGWAAGVVLASLAWPAAFISSRYVDKSEREKEIEASHLRVSDRWMFAGVGLVFASILCFSLGAACMAGHYSVISTLPPLPEASAQ